MEGIHGFDLTPVPRSGWFRGSSKRETSLGLSGLAGLAGLAELALCTSEEQSLASKAKPPTNTSGLYIIIPSKDVHLLLLYGSRAMKIESP